MSDIKYYGTQTIHGHDGKPLDHDQTIGVRFKGLDSVTPTRAGHIEHLDHRPDHAYPTGYIIL